MTRVNEFFGRLEGTWKNRYDDAWLDSYGWNFLSQPKLGHATASDFEIRVDRMRETIVFRPLGTLARNVGVTGKAEFWEGLSYEVSIESPSGEPLHQESGHFLLNVNERGETPEPVTGEIIRQGVVPRANAFLLAGKLTRGSVSDLAATPPDPYRVRPEVGDLERQAKIDEQFAAQQELVTGQGGPEFTAPLRWLQGILAENPVGDDWAFKFRPHGSVQQILNGQRVSSRVLLGAFSSDFWISRRKRGEHTLDVLQYAQRVDLAFGGVHWPHVGVNTLIKA